MIEMNITRKDIVASGNPVPPVNFAPESEQTLTTEVDPSITRMKFNLICASKCKKFALEMAKAQLGPTRQKMFTRVSQEFLIACEANMKEFIRNRVRCHPSKGKTLT